MQADEELEILYVIALDQIESGDKQDAFKILLELAERGYVPAMCVVGNLYSAGIGTPENKKLAIRWWRRAAGKGDVSSMLNIGTEYRDCLGNFRQAQHWFLKAAGSGDAQAHLELARLWYGHNKLRYRARTARYVDTALSGEGFLSEEERQNAELLREELLSQPSVRRRP